MDLYDTEMKAGNPHRGVYHAYIRVSTKTQTVERQKEMIRKYLNGGKHEVKYYIDEGWSGDLPPEQRENLRLCINDAMKNKRKGGNGSLIISDFSRFSRNVGHSYTFLTDVVQRNKVKLIVVDTPILEEMDLRQQVMFLKDMARKAEDYREDVSRKTLQGLDAIKEEINSAGFYTTREGKVIRKLGVHDNMDKARDKAKDKVTDNANNWALHFYDDIKYRIGAGHSYRSIAEEFNSKPQYQRPRGGDWYASTIANIIKRVERGDE
tara:strand:- start:300 stop:1094 length:795 start_codon:yes stop_codon:yes gene_type:complete